MNSVVIVNLLKEDANILQRIKYNLEKAGFSITEEYSDGVETEHVKNDTVTLVFSKTKNENP